MDSRFSISTIFSLLLHLMVLAVLSELAFFPPGTAGAGEQTRLLGVVELQQAVEQLEVIESSDARRTAQEAVDNHFAREPTAVDNKIEVGDSAIYKKEAPAAVDENSQNNKEKHTTSNQPVGYSKEEKPGVNEQTTGYGSDRLQNEYLQQLIAKIERARKYPALARRRRQQGMVRLRVIINRSGQLENVEITDTSRYELLNEEALATIKRAVPLPALPEEFNRERLEITIPIRFQLQ